MKFIALFMLFLSLLFLLRATETDGEINKLWVAVALLAIVNAITLATSRSDS